MNITYPKFKEALSIFLCFSTEDIRKHFPKFDRKRLTEWQKKGFLQKVIRENYVFNDIEKDSFFWWYVANRIFTPSYISLQSALSYYSFIPEAVFQITSISTKRTKNVDTNGLRFIYKNLKKSCYFGFTLIPFANDHQIRVAEPEKAILDLLYLNSSLEEDNDFESWRFNKSIILETIDMSRLQEYALQMQNQKFYNRYLSFKKWLNA